MKHIMFIIFEKWDIVLSLIRFFCRKKNALH